MASATDGIESGQTEKEIGEEKITLAMMWKDCRNAIVDAFVELERTPGNAILFHE